MGICLGMQLASIEFARNVCGLSDANSTEMDAETHAPVISLMANQEDINEMGGTQRLGAYPCVLTAGTLASKLYQTDEITERHRHRYEFNNAFRDTLAEHGMVFSGTSPNGQLVEIIELKNHPFFIASQFHPEFLSRPNHPHPIFLGFVQAALANKK